MTDIQRENQIKQHRESLQKQLELEEQLAPVRVQNEYNKENIKTQHKYNLEIFEKQAALTRELHQKQSDLARTSMRVIAFVTFFTAIIAVILGIYLERNWLNMTLQSFQEQSAPTIQEQNAPVLPSLGEKETIKATKQ